MGRSIKLSFLFLSALAMVLISNCKKNYTPPVINSPTSYLVVEGVIDPGGDTTTIRLSKTVNLSAAVSSLPLLGATIIVTSDGGASYPVIETGQGYYKALLSLNAASKYQLKIVAEGNSYTSDFVQVKNAPAIDTVGYSIHGNGVQISLNTHDATNNSRYYRWTYKETYLIHSAYDTQEKFVQVPKDTVVYRPYTEQIYACWLTDSSSTIVLGSSAKLVQDVISNQPITQVPSTSEKFTDLYSIQVKQYALTTDAYNYYLHLAKNTEQLGSIFDAQPSELPSNIHCSNNPSLTVIGYITAGNYTQKRIFVDSRKLPAWKPLTPYGGCILDTVLFNYRIAGTTVNQVAQYIYSGAQLPVYVTTTGPPLSIITGYAASTPFCVDCTLRGTNVKPSFWP